MYEPTNFSGFAPQFSDEDIMKHKISLLTAIFSVATITLAGCVSTVEAQTASTSEAPAPAPAAAVTTVAAAQPDPAILGRALFLRCAACHAVTAAEQQKIGPHLQQVVGREAGSIPGFAFSDAMKASDIVWDSAKLDQFLTRPAGLVPGTSMAFGGIDSADQRAALIAYLQTLN